MPDLLKLGTRGSPLAVAQSTLMARALERVHPGLTVELVRITTTGDRMQRGPVKPADSTKAVFTKELEEAMLAGEIDFAVHSCKDLAALMPPGLVLAAIPQRASHEDILISRQKGGEVMDKEGAVLATGSLRRSLLWRERYPATRFEPLRGNIDSRIRRLREQSEWDGIILAHAGLERLSPDLSGLVITPIPTDWMLPAPGQGALALQARSDDVLTCQLLQALDHGPTRRLVEIERAFLGAMEAGCHVPLGALAEELEDGKFRLRAVYYEGNHPVGRRGEVLGTQDEFPTMIGQLVKMLKAT